MTHRLFVYGTLAPRRSNDDVLGAGSKRLAWLLSGMRQSRLRSYSTMLLGAVCFGLLGAAFDQLTVSISPEYFVLGKHIAGNATLRWSAAVVGFRGGLAVGALCAGVFVWLRVGERPVRWQSFFGLAMLATIPATLLAATIMLAVDPFHVRADSHGLLAPDRATRYLLCWSLHIGAYLGPTLAAIVLAAQAPEIDRRARA